MDLIHWLTCECSGLRKELSFNSHCGMNDIFGRMLLTWACQGSWLVIHLTISKPYLFYRALDDGVYDEVHLWYFNVLL